MLALENAERHLRCATHLSKIKEFGVAQSHLILSVEEAIKALFLCFKGLGMPIRQKKLNNLLTKHKPRHEIGTLLYIIFTMAIWFINTIKTANEKAEHKTEQEALQIRNQTFQKIIVDLQKSASSDNSMTEINRLVLPLKEWWETAGQKKEVGFYVDFQYGKWSSPNLIKKHDYLQSLKIAQDVIKYTKKGVEIIESLSDEERTEIAREMKSKYQNSVKLYKAKNNQKANCPEK